MISKLATSHWLNDDLYWQEMRINIYVHAPRCWRLRRGRGVWGAAMHFRVLLWPPALVVLGSSHFNSSATLLNRTPGYLASYGNFRIWVYFGLLFIAPKNHLRGAVILRGTPSSVCTLSYKNKVPGAGLESKGWVNSLRYSSVTILRERLEVWNSWPSSTRADPAQIFTFLNYIP